MKIKLGTRKYYEDYYWKIDKEQHKRVSDQFLTPSVMSDQICEK